MNARQPLHGTTPTDRGTTTTSPNDEVHDALNAPAAPTHATTDEDPERPTAHDWREDLETTRRARLAVDRLRRDLAAGVAPALPSGPDLAALVEEFDLMRAVLAASWKRAADLLDAVPHHPSALTGPYWYGEGWDDAVRHLRDLANGMNRPTTAEPCADRPPRSLGR